MASGVGLVEAGALPGRTKLDNLLGWDGGGGTVPSSAAASPERQSAPLRLLTTVRRAGRQAGGRPVVRVESSVHRLTPAFTGSMSTTCRIA
ncbi:MAG: hypothetical protein M3Y35_09930 [Actinomycetota bacterium]|nr:hypothetical protein [Actinomycetota bacterium]